MTTPPHETLSNAVNAYTAVGQALADAAAADDRDRKIKAAQLPPLPGIDKK